MKELITQFGFNELHVFIPLFLMQMGAALGGVGMVLIVKQYLGMHARWNGVLIPLAFAVVYFINFQLLVSLLEGLHRYNETAQAGGGGLMTDLDTGIPNRRALSLYLQKKQSSRDGKLLVWEVANTAYLLECMGVEELSVSWKRAVRLMARRAKREWGVDIAKVFLFGDFSIALWASGDAGNKREEELAGWLTRCADEVFAGLYVVGKAVVFQPAVIERFSTGQLPYREIALALNSIRGGVVHLGMDFFEAGGLHRNIHQQIERWKSGEAVKMAFQPKIHLRTGKIIGAEALLRPSDGGGLPLSPLEVVNHARRTGWLPELEWRTIEHVIRWIQSWPDRPERFAVAVNLSGDSLCEPGFGQRLLTLMQSERISPQALKVEVLEWSDRILEPTASGNIRLLIEHGVRMSLDDLGAGYSSLSLLSRYDFFEVKIDMSLVKEISSNRSAAIVEMAVKAAHECGASVVAEGVETPEMARQLLDMGVDCGQGWLFSRAVSFSELRQMVSTERVSFAMPASVVEG